MEQVLARGTVDAADQLPFLPEQRGQALNVTMVFQDSLTRRWVMDLWARVGQISENGALSCRSWNINDLAHDAQFAAAVRAAATADVLVIAVRESGELPLFLHVWIDAWVPKRHLRKGALVALLGVPGEATGHPGSTRHYLKAVARSAGLDFVVNERAISDSVAGRSESHRLSRSSSRPKRANRQLPPLRLYRRVRE